MRASTSKNNFIEEFEKKILLLLYVSKCFWSIKLLEEGGVRSGAEKGF